MPIDGVHYLDSRPEVHIIVGMPGTMIGPDELKFGAPPLLISARQYMSQNTDVALRIIPRFRNLAGTGNKHSNGQVEVDIATGAVTLLPFIGPVTKPNFIVDVEATDLSTTPNAVHRARIRVHIHRSIKRVWLTPDPLTVHLFTTGPASGGANVGRFSFRAEFDDGTVGDITELPGVAWNHPLVVGPDGVVNIPPTQPSSMLIEAFIGALSAQADLLRGVDLNGTQQVFTSLVQHARTINGSPSSSLGHAQVLLLAEGYSTGQLGAFEGHARDIAHLLTTEALAGPFPRVAGSLEFTSAFIPALASAPGKEGVSIGAEVFMDGDPQSMVARSIHLVPFAGSVDGLAPGAVWGLNELIHAVGLPMPTDALSNTGRLNADILNEWSYSLDVDPRLHLGGPLLIDPTVIFWRALATRGLVDLLDSGLGVEAGSLRPDHRAHDLQVNKFRSQRIRLDEVLKGMPSGMNATWTSGGFPPGNSDLVCLVCSAPGQAKRESGWFVHSISEAAVARATITTTRRFELHPPVMSVAQGSSAVNAMARAFGEALTLGNERGNVLGPPDASTVNTLTDDRSNLQAESAFNWSAGTAPSASVRWNWHRIREAGLIVQPLGTVIGSFVKVRLQAGEARAFALGDLVHLRNRRLTLELSAVPLLSIPLIVEGINGDELTLQDRQVPFTYAHKILLNQLSSVFGRSDVIYTPKAGGAWSAPVAPFPVPPFPYQDLVANKIKAVIDQVSPAIPAPLTGLPLMRDDNDDQIPNLRGALLPRSIMRNLPRVVGLYSGGADLHMGVLHPAGHCRMRTKHGRISSFCMICQYQLVDQIEPRQHGALDRVYQKFYPG
ncbi:MAG: hypothetical protein ABI432_02570 [Flavobacteriales bacterium]